MKSIIATENNSFSYSFSILDGVTPTIRWGRVTGWRVSDSERASHNDSSTEQRPAPLSCALPAGSTSDAVRCVSPEAGRRLVHKVRQA